MTLTDWLAAAELGLSWDGTGSRATYAGKSPARKIFDTDSLEWLEEAVAFAPSQHEATREAQAWLETVAHLQHGGRTSFSSGVVQARHLLALTGCSPRDELQKAFPSIWRELLSLIRPGTADEARAVGLAATGEVLRRLLEDGEASGTPIAGAARGSRKSEVGAEVHEGGGRQVVVSFLPKVVPTVTACLEDIATKSRGADGSALVASPASCALGVLDLLAFSLRSTMRPHLRRIQIVSAPWLQGPHDGVRDRAAAVLASLALCGEAEAWTQVVVKVTLEAHSILEAAWPDDEVDMGVGIGSKQLEKALGDAGGGFLEPSVDPERTDKRVPQQTMAALVSRRFKGLCRVLELMLTGDSNGKAVALPVPLIIALVERVQRLSTVVQAPGPQAYIPVAQGALSTGALKAIRSTLELEASRLLGALASATPAMVLRRSRRMCRALVDSATRSSSPPWLRAAGYRAVERATLQLGAGSTKHLAVPVVRSLLAEARLLLSSWESPGSSSSSFGESIGSGEAKLSNGAALGRSGDDGMRVEPAVSVRKSSQKKQRRLREKEVGRALAAADSASSPAQVPAGAVSSGHGAVQACSDTVVEAGCAALSCLTKVVLCCKAYLPLAARLAVEDVLYRGLELLARSSFKGLGGSARGKGAGGSSPWTGTGPGSLPLVKDPRVMREFVLLAHACVVIPLGDGTRSGALSVALRVFRSLRSHPDDKLAAASEQALAACGAILYPRAAPLHFPPAITSQAKAWGSGDGEGSPGLPLGWGKVLRRRDALSDDSHEGEQAGDDQIGGGMVGSGLRSESPRKKVKMMSNLSLSSPDGGDKCSRTAAVVTPSSETAQDVLCLSVGSSDAPGSAEAQLGGKREAEGRQQVELEKLAAAGPGAVEGAVEIGQGDVTVRNSDSDSGSGRQGRAVAGSPKPHHAGSNGKPGDRDNSFGIEEEMTGVSDDRGPGEESDISIISKQSHEEPSPRVDRRDANPMATTEEAGISSGQPICRESRGDVTGDWGRATDGGKGRGSASDEEHSDDDFKFPSIVDADPDED